jgi:GxxExxY protein
MNADTASSTSRGSDRGRDGGFTHKIIGVFFDVYNELGAGFLESVYQTAMAMALEDAGLHCELEKPISVLFRGRPAGTFRADLVVERTVLLELKAARSIDEAFERQLLNYLRATDLEVGLLLNFGPKPGFRRLAYDNQRKHRQYPRTSAQICGEKPPGIAPSELPPGRRC